MFIVKLKFILLFYFKQFNFFKNVMWLWKIGIVSMYFNYELWLNKNEQTPLALLQVVAEAWFCILTRAVYEISNMYVNNQV